MVNKIYVAFERVQERLVDPSARTKVMSMLIEMTFAFILVLGATFLLFLIGNRLAPLTTDRDEGQHQYACGESPIGFKQKTSISLYRYLIYFLVMDSSLLIIAFAVLGVVYANLLSLLMYLSIILVSSLLFLEGGNQ